MAPPLLSKIAKLGFEFLAPFICCIDQVLDILFLVLEWQNMEDGYRFGYIFALAMPYSVIVLTFALFQKYFKTEIGTQTYCEVLGQFLFTSFIIPIFCGWGIITVLCYGPHIVFQGLLYWTKLRQLASFFQDQIPYQIMKKLAFTSWVELIFQDSLQMVLQTVHNNATDNWDGFQIASIAFSCLGWIISLKEFFGFLYDINHKRKIKNTKDKHKENKNQMTQADLNV